jgi:hypothetical protein
MAPRIGLIHALRESVEPIRAAFARHWPEAELMNLLDDSLSADLAREGRLTPEMIERFIALGRYARDTEVAAILFTCSAFGPAIEAVSRDLAPLPVHKPNTAGVADAVARGGKVALLASFAPTLASMTAEFPACVEIQVRHCTGALEALEAGDADAHDRIAAAAAAEAFGSCDCILLAQFSLARAAAAVAAATGKPVVTTPDAAVRALRAIVERPG